MLTFVVLLLFFGGLKASFDQEVEDYTRYIQGEYQKAENYRLPTDASQYEPHNQQIKDFGSFDFVVIGAGDGGTVVANRLSEVHNWTVLLLDAGDFGNNFTRIPSTYSPINFSGYNWGYRSTPQSTSCLGMKERRCMLPRGKGIGGTTLINGLIYSRGHRIDFDRWAALGNPGWSYNEVLPYFRKSENLDVVPPLPSPVEDFYHGHGGPLNVEFHRPIHPQLEKFLEANQQIGIPNADFNSNKIASSATQLNTVHGSRCDSGTAFIRPIKQRPNLKIMTYSYVIKILLESDRATGAIFSNNKQLYRVLAKKEVIVSGGSYNTPHLLMLSGIGPRKHLQSKGIPVIADLEVGSNLKDHAMYFGTTYTTNISSPILPYQEYVREFLNGTGPLTSPGGNDGIGFYESSFTKGTGYPEIELVMKTSNATNDFIGRAFGLTDATYDAIWKDLNPTQTFIIYVVALHCKSLGTVRLQSSNPYDYPLLDTKFLSDPKGRDIQLIYEGIQLTQKLINTPALKSINTTLATKPFKECSQYPDTQSKDYIMCAIRVASTHVYHPVSTCPMGPNKTKGDVVNSNLKIHGFKNLRVIDASVFPFTLSGHPSAVTVMVAEKGSDLIKREHGVH